MFFTRICATLPSGELDLYVTVHVIPISTVCVHVYNFLQKHIWFGDFNPTLHISLMTALSLVHSCTLEAHFFLSLIDLILPCENLRCFLHSCRLDNVADLCYWSVFMLKQNCTNALMQKMNYMLIQACLYIYSSTVLKSKDHGTWMQDQAQLYFYTLVLLLLNKNFLHLWM